MAGRKDLVDWVHAALTALGGKAKIARICEHIWRNHESDIRGSGDFFFIWQYEMRWAGDMLVRAGRITKKVPGEPGTWALKK
jgi:hypothetical protein